MLVRWHVAYDRARAADGCDTDMAVLAAGVPTPAHLLILLKDFTTERGQGGRTLKVVGRYQQFQAVRRLARKHGAHVLDADGMFAELAAALFERC